MSVLAAALVFEEEEACELVLAFFERGSAAVRPRPDAERSAGARLALEKSE